MRKSYSAVVLVSLVVAVVAALAFFGPWLFVLLGHSC
jgi:hypothetical protein